MTRCKFLVALGVIALLVQGASAQVTVTFRLNTCTVNAHDITDESMVQVRGSIAPITWDDGSVSLVNTAGDYWEAVVTFDASETGNTLEYKYYAEDWESTENKTLLLDQDVTLDLAYFNNGFNPPYTPTADIDLWFRVSMESNAIFNPDTDEVGMRGAGVDDLSWSTNLVLDREVESFYYSGQVTAPVDSAGVTIEYKFVCGAGPDWESLPEGNRTLVIPAEDQTIVWAWWNNEEPSPAIIDTGVVTFKADMSELIANGWFDAGTDWISVRGNFEGWGNQEPMVPGLVEPTIYEWGYEIIAEHESTISWKFKAFPDENFLDSGWELGANHEFPFIGEEVLEPRLPNIWPAGGPLEVDVTLNVACDMTNAICWYTGEPFPSIGSVWLAGDDGTGPLEWPSWDPDDTTSMIRLYDDGTHGDQTPGDGIWAADVLMPEGTSSTILYKYSVWYPGVENLNNGSTPMDNEAGFAMNHAAVLDRVDENQEIFDEFGSQPVHEIKGAAKPEVVALGYNWPNPFSQNTCINYTIPVSGEVNLSVYDLSGRKVTMLHDGYQNAGMYAAMWNGRDTSNKPVATGTYLMRLESAAGSATRRIVVLR